MSIGRIVLYTLSEGDCTDIVINRMRRDDAGSNTASPGAEYPAIVVRVWGTEYTETAVNLKVFLDGEDTHWVSSRKEGTGPNTWRWPPRVDMTREGK